MDSFQCFIDERFDAVGLRLCVSSLISCLRVHMPKTGESIDLEIPWPRMQDGGRERKRERGCSKTPEVDTVRVTWSKGIPSDWVANSEVTVLTHKTQLNPSQEVALVTSSHQACDARHPKQFGLLKNFSPLTTLHGQTWCCTHRQTHKSTVHQENKSTAFLYSHTNVPLQVTPFQISLLAGGHRVK